MLSVAFLVRAVANYATLRLGTPLRVRLRREECGQDLIEYALLAAFIGVAGALVLQTMNATIFNTYSSWVDPTIGTPSLWEPGAPLGSGS